MAFDRKVRRLQGMVTYSGEVTRAVDRAVGTASAPRRVRRAQAALVRRGFWKRRDAEDVPPPAPAAPKPVAFPAPARSSVEVRIRTLGVERFAPPPKDEVLDFTPRDLQSCILRAFSREPGNVDVHDDVARARTAARFRVAADTAVLDYVREHEGEGLVDLGWSVRVTWEQGVVPHKPDERPALVVYVVDRDGVNRTVQEYERALWASAGKEVPAWGR